jgi:hypothetical protein
MPRRRVLFAILLLALAGLLRFAPAAEQPAPNLESKIKAVLMLKLVTHVDWPASAFADANAPFQIGILGDDPFGKLLEEVLAGETSHGRAIQIRRSASAADLAACQLIFVSATEKERAQNDVAAFAKKPVLTVSDIEQFARKGGMVGFIREKNSVRLEINIDACAEAGLTVSARLASIARVVENKK